jgi:hypothetical protein
LQGEVTCKKLPPLIVTSELLAMTVFSLEMPQQRFVNLLGFEITVVHIFLFATLMMHPKIGYNWGKGVCEFNYVSHEQRFKSATFQLTT